ncbi:hypothetical protein GCM10010498_54060 [Streptomyces cavourensis]|nr:hypothetical protein GCM10010498_54060 [Streptomyces cavourensis]
MQDFQGFPALFDVALDMTSEQRFGDCRGNGNVHIPSAGQRFEESGAYEAPGHVTGYRPCLQRLAVAPQPLLAQAHLG